jgi:hypothetical protein
MPPDFFETHWVVTAIGATICLWISICFILRVWIIHRKANLLKKLFWSIILLIPGFGWLAFGALFHLPGFNDTSSGGFDASGGYWIGHDGGSHGGGHGDGGHGAGH